MLSLYFGQCSTSKFWKLEPINIHCSVPLWHTTRNPPLMIVLSLSPPIISPHRLPSSPLLRPTVSLSFITNSHSLCSDEERTKGEGGGRLCMHVRAWLIGWEDPLAIPACTILCIIWSRYTMKIRPMKQIKSKTLTVFHLTSTANKGYCDYHLVTNIGYCDYFS